MLCVYLARKSWARGLGTKPPVRFRRSVFQASRQLWPASILMKSSPGCLLPEYYSLLGLISAKKSPPTCCNAQCRSLGDSPQVSLCLPVALTVGHSPSLVGLHLATVDGVALYSVSPRARLKVRTGSVLSQPSLDRVHKKGQACLS